MEYDLSFAREQAVWVATDRVAHMSSESKTILLKQIDLMLDRWKMKQARADGSIIVELPHADVIWLDSRGNEPRRHASFLAAKLRPEQCAGPFVRSKSDLFNQLWADGYGPIRKIAHDAGHDIVLALLVERDGASMPAGSLAGALHYIWIRVWASRETARKMLSKEQAKRSERTANARANSAIAREEAAKTRNNKLLTMAAELHRDDPALTSDEIAEKLHFAVKNEPGFGQHTPGGIAKRIKGYDTASRMPKRQP